VQQHFKETTLLQLGLNPNIKKLRQSVKRNLMSFKNKIILLVCLALMNRIVFANPYLTSSDGEFTGFFSAIISLIGLFGAIISLGNIFDKNESTLKGIATFVGSILIIYLSAKYGLLIELIGIALLLIGIIYNFISKESKNK
jgi:hypothetical protein